MYRKYCMILAASGFFFLLFANAVLAVETPAGKNAKDRQEQAAVSTQIAYTENVLLENENAMLYSKVCEQKMEPLIGSHPRVQCSVLARTYRYPVTSKERDMLERIVEAEASGETLEGKRLVANVILNRISSEEFPDTVADVIFQRNRNGYQFSPVSDGRYYAVKISQESREAVEQALLGVDESEGALYFMSRKYAQEEKSKWFDSHLTRLFAYGGHEFFK